MVAKHLLWTNVNSTNNGLIRERAIQHWKGSREEWVHLKLRSKIYKLELDSTNESFFFFTETPKGLTFLQIGLSYSTQSIKNLALFSCWFIPFFVFVFILLCFTYLDHCRSVAWGILEHVLLKWFLACWGWSVQFWFLRKWLWRSGMDVGKEGFSSLKNKNRTEGATASSIQPIRSVDNQLVGLQCVVQPR